VKLTALSSRSDRANIETFMYYTVAQQGYFRSGKVCYIQFVDDSFVFPIVKKIQNRLTIGEVIAKSLGPCFLETQCLPADR